MKKIAAVLLACGAWLTAQTGWAQTPAAQGIYTCVDAKGRKLTSDRPIPDCADREQKVLNPSGTLKQTVGPALTAQERAAKEQKEKQALEERKRMAEERRRDKALMVRYPTLAVHEQERKEALAQIELVRQAAVNRINELTAQRNKLHEELEFYKKDPSKVPAYLRRQVEDNAQSASVQKRFIAEQDNEAKRVNLRFDDELARLQQLWPPGSNAK